MTIFFNKKVDALKRAYPPYKSNPFVIARRYDEAISTIPTNLLPRQNGVVRTPRPTFSSGFLLSQESTLK